MANVDDVAGREPVQTTTPSATAQSFPAYSAADPVIAFLHRLGLHRWTMYGPGRDEQRRPTAAWARCGCGASRYLGSAGRTYPKSSVGVWLWFVFVRPKPRMRRRGTDA